jgi:hypothetical protein
MGDGYQAKCGQVLGSKHESTSREATQMVQTQVKTKQEPVENR